jgi:hypothetical protein
VASPVRTRIVWEQLGWRPAPGVRAPGRDEGPVSLLVIAPWCPDCEEAARELEGVSAAGRPVWLVGEFAEPEDTLAFVRRHRLDWPVLLGTHRKDEIARNQARFRQLREALGDPRRWGVPTWIEGRLRNGWLEVERLNYPA